MFRNPEKRMFAQARGRGIERRLNDLEHIEARQTAEAEAAHLEEIQNRVEAATPGPWKVESGRVTGRTLIGYSRTVGREVRIEGIAPHTRQCIEHGRLAEFLGDRYRPVAEAIAETRNATPDLLEMQRLRNASNYLQAEAAAKFGTTRYWEFDTLLRRLPDDDWAAEINREGTVAEILSAGAVNPAVSKAARALMATVVHEDGSDVAADLDFIMNAVADARFLMKLTFDVMAARWPLPGGTEALIDRADVEAVERFGGPLQLAPDGRVWNGRQYLDEYLVDAIPGVEKVRFRNGDLADLRRWNVTTANVCKPWTISIPPDVQEAWKARAAREGADLNVLLAQHLAKAANE